MKNIENIESLVFDKQHVKLESKPEQLATDETFKTFEIKIIEMELQEHFWNKLEEDLVTTIPRYMRFAFQ